MFKTNDLNDSTFNLDTKPSVNLNNKNNTNFIINSFPNNVAPGNLNSLKRLTTLQNIHLNSCFRHNYFNSSSCDFQYVIPSDIKNVVSLRLVSIEIPNAWYLFSHKQKNNVFNIEVNIDNTVTTYTITIPDGNYDSDSLQQFLNTTYFSQSKTDTYLKYIHFSIDNNSFKSTFEVLDNPSITVFSFSLCFLYDINENPMNTVGWLLGFRLSSYLNVSVKIQSEGLFDACGDKYIYFGLNDYQYNNNSNNIVGFDKSIMDENILAKIPMINGKLSFIIDENNNLLAKKRVYNGPVTLRKLYIKIMDKFGNVIDLNNMDFSFTLEVELLYESFNFKDVSA